MAVSFIARKCACGGKLEFDPQKKIWICKYCGTVVEREATFDKVHVDGIEGISDVVRQTLMDIANNKMDSASRNLEDCERKNHMHVGTLLANISYNLSMISYAKSQDEARGYLDKVKVYAKRFQTEFPAIAEDEINLYEAFGDGTADIYANLLVVFDTLNDSNRIEYILSKLHIEEIFSEHANKNFLKIALKRQNFDIAEAVVNNISHIDKQYSLREILMNYPIQDKKAGIVQKLFSAQIAEALGKGFFERYFENSTDSVDMKTTVILKLSTTNLRCNAETIVKAVYNQMDSYEHSKEIFSALYETKYSDQETEALLVFCLMINKEYYVLKAFLDTLDEKSVFMQLGSREVISFLDSSSLGACEKRAIVKKMFKFEMDSKSKDAIYNYYLNNNADDKDTRLEILKELLVEGCPISNSTVKNYVVKTTRDKENKFDIINLIFATGINKTYLGDLLSEYLISACDEKSIKDAITELLINDGFKIDSNVLMQYIANGSDEIDAKIFKVKKFLQNGTQVKADCLESYILSVGKTNVFSEELFNLLAKNAFAISANAYAKFLLECADIDKVRHNSKILSSITSDLNASYISLSHLGNSLTCNVLQAYILNAKDSYDVVKAIVNEMLASKIKLNSEITVGNSMIKFKKYVADNKTSLSPLTLQICEENRMFSLF